jgi:hypothetical protein
MLQLLTFYFGKIGDSDENQALHNAAGDACRMAKQTSAGCDRLSQGGE